MTKQELINQLLSLKVNSKSFISSDNDCDIWKKDIEALEIAIDFIEKNYQEGDSNR